MAVKKARRRITKAHIVSAIIRIRCVLKILNSKDEFELNLAWRVLMTVKKFNLLKIYEDDLNSLYRFYGSQLTSIPLEVYRECFIMPVQFTFSNTLEVF